MYEIINLLNQHNARIIQIIFSVVLILLLVYVYRTFFVGSADRSGLSESSDLNEVSEKLNQLLNHQKSAHAIHAEGMPASVGVADEQVAKLKSEILKLRTQLNESEKKVFEMVPASTEPGVTVDPAESKTQISEMTKKIEALQSRLSEYDIIADDIAELSQLRTENLSLKNKLESFSGTSGTGEVIDGNAALISAVEVDHSDLVMTNPVVPEIDKNLMSDFEKSTQKG